MCFEDDHIVNIFSFSKAFGMMGWRLGYIAAPAPLQLAMGKVHDTIAICASAAAQRVGLGALQLEAAGANVDGNGGDDGTAGGGSSGSTLITGGATSTAEDGDGAGGNVRGSGVDGAGLTWVGNKVASLAGAHSLIKNVLTSTLGADAVRGGTGAIYFLARRVKVSV